MAKFLVVGLGNPGVAYALSPHNIGFLALDRLGEREGIRIHRREAKALVGRGEIGGAAVLLAKPQTYMNLSGKSVKALVDKHGYSADELIVAYDDHDLPWGALRIRLRGSAGGHHGMESIISSLGTSEFARLRLGINPGARRADPEFLLQPLRREQYQQLGDLLDQAAQALASIISEGAAKAMTRFNRRAQGRPFEEE